MKARGIALSLTTLFALSGCSNVKIPDVTSLQSGGQEVSAAAQKCSEGSQAISDQTQVLVQAINTKDTAAAKAAGLKLAAASAEIKQGAADGMAAAGKLGSAAGSQQVEAGVTAAFKICAAVAGYGQDLADKVAAAKGPAAYKQLSNAADALSHKASEAANQAASQMSS
jgi:hypothetical protein